MEQQTWVHAIKPAEITESEAQRQSQVNRSVGEKHAAILEAEGKQQATVPRTQRSSTAPDQL
jgi:regulator of protease activity HflC (stomatin/prohibitin superfamily)